MIFRKRYGIKNQKSDIGVCTNSFMAAILDYKMAAVYMYCMGKGMQTATHEGTKTP